MKYNIGGVSIRGSYHDINQDSFKYADFSFGQVLALSDGLGSRNLSQVGSSKFCECVVELAKETKCSVEIFGGADGFLTELHQRWLAALGDNDVSDCYCTAMFVMIKNGCYISCHLGDGALIVMADDECHVSLEAKNSFSNMTEAFTEELELEKWYVEKHDFDVMQGVYLSSDGVSLRKYSDSFYAEYACDFFSGYKGMSAAEIETHVKGWLTDWPDNDDKTLVFLIPK